MVDSEENQQVAVHHCLNARRMSLQIRFRTTLLGLLVGGSHILSKYVLDIGSNAELVGMDSGTLNYAMDLLFGVGVALVVLSLAIAAMLDYFSKRTLRKVGVSEPAINVLWKLSAKDIVQRAQGSF